MAKKSKSRKPYKDFPLSPHATGKWRKNIRSKTYYFGSWDDPVGVLKEYLAKKDYLQAGVAVPSADADITEVRDLGRIIHDDDRFCSKSNRP